MAVHRFEAPEIEEKISPAGPQLIFHLLMERYIGGSPEIPSQVKYDDIISFSSLQLHSPSGTNPDWPFALSHLDLSK
jgi:hypothetical protein